MREIKQSVIAASLCAVGCLISASVALKTSAETEKDKTPPVIEVDTLSYQAGNFPVGEVNVGYPVFAATSFDVRDGARNTEVNVYLKGSNRNIYDEGKNQFVPEKSGVYIIEYSASDASGNTASVRYTIQIAERVEAPSITLSGIYEEIIFAGQEIQLPSAVSGGGSGNVTKSCSIVFGENVVQTYPGVENNSYIFDEAGTYTIIYTAKDFLNRTASVSYEVKVTRSDLPVISPLNADPYAIAGEKLYMDVTAYEYNENNEKNPLEVQYSVNYNGKTEPVQNGAYYIRPIGERGSISELTVICKAVGKKGIGSREEKIKVINAGDARKYLPAYFITSDNVNVSDVGACTFATRTNGETIRFAKSLLAEGLTMGFTLRNVNMATVTLSGAKNNGETVSFTLKKAAGGAKLYFNENAFYEIKGEEREFIFSYDESTRTLRYNTEAGNLLSGSVKIEKYADGRDFNGFSDGKVYFSLAFDEIESEATCEFSKIADIVSITSNELTDYASAQLFIENLTNTRVESGTKVRLMKAYARDTLSGIDSQKVRIIDPDGEEIFSSENLEADFEFTADKYGVYLFKYEIYDTSAARNLTEKQIALTVIDRMPPEITVKALFPAEARIGDKIFLPRYEAKDNQTAEEDLLTFVEIIDPDGYRKAVLKEDVEAAFEYEFTKSGVYVVRYYAEDEDGNISVKKFEISVKQEVRE